MSLVTRLLRRSFSSTTTSTTSTTKAFSKISGEKNLKILVEKFKLASDDNRFRKNTGIYKNSVRRLANAQRFKWVEEILEHQKQYKDISKEGFAARIINLYGMSGMFDNAQKMFDEMPQRNCNRTVLSFNALLGASVNCKRYDLVDGIFKNLSTELGVEPDLVSYNILIRAYCEMESIDSASLLVDEMEKKGLNPDVITFNTLLNGSYLNGRFMEGERVWDRMLSKNVVPNVKSYNARLEGLVMEKKMKEAVELVGEMRTKSVGPDAFSFNFVIKGFVDEGNLEEAKQWYDDMENSGCAFNRGTFGILVPLLCERGELEFALKLCKEVIGKRYLVEEGLLQRVVDGLVKESRMEEAIELVQLGKTNKYCQYKLKLPSQE